MLWLYIARALALLSADGGSGGEEVRRNQVDVVSHEDIGTKNVVCPLFRSVPYFALLMLSSMKEQNPKL